MAAGPRFRRGVSMAGLALAGLLGCGAPQELDPGETSMLVSRLQILGPQGGAITDLTFGRTVTFQVEIGNPNDRPASLQLPRPPIAVEVSKQGFPLWTSPTAPTGGVETRSIPAGGRTTFTLAWTQVNGSGQPLEPGSYLAVARIAADASEDRWRIVLPDDVPFRIFALDSW